MPTDTATLMPPLFLGEVDLTAHDRANLANIISRLGLDTALRSVLQQLRAHLDS